MLRTLEAGPTLVRGCDLEVEGKLDMKVASHYTDTNHVQTIRGAQITVDSTCGLGFKEWKRK